MLEKLDFMVRFWNLRMRHEYSGTPLSHREQIELLSLLTLMASDHPLPEPGPPTITDSPLPIRFTGPSGFLAAEICFVCASGMIVSCRAPLKRGETTIVRLADAVSGVEYILPCIVEWSHNGKYPAMALRVDGEASCVQFTTIEAWLGPPAPTWSERPAAG